MPRNQQPIELVHDQMMRQSLEDINQVGFARDRWIDSSVEQQHRQQSQQRGSANPIANDGNIATKLGRSLPDKSHANPAATTDQPPTSTCSAAEAPSSTQTAHQRPNQLLKPQEQQYKREAFRLDVSNYYLPAMWPTVESTIISPPDRIAA